LCFKNIKARIGMAIRTKAKQTAVTKVFISVKFTYVVKDYVTFLRLMREEIMKFRYPFITDLMNVLKKRMPLIIAISFCKLNLLKIKLYQPHFLAHTLMIIITIAKRVIKTKAKKISPRFEKMLVVL